MSASAPFDLPLSVAAIFSECQTCRGLDSGEWDAYAAEPSVTDRYIWLYNQILHDVHEVHPGKKIGFYAYHTYKLPPRRHKPDPHIVPALAPITLCRIHGLSNPICPDRSFYRSLMSEWGELVPEVFERGYYYNLACPGFPFSKIHALAGLRVGYGLAPAALMKWLVRVREPFNVCGIAQVAAQASLELASQP